MPDLEDGQQVEVQGSAALPYVLKNTGGVYSCSCPAWRNQSAPIERRTCKHLRRLRGDAAETERVGSAAPAPRAVRPKPSGDAAQVTEAKAPPLLLAHTWETHIDLTGWWMSEKLDGVRAYWNGETFVSRLGNAYRAPPWFTEGLPPTPLDGELWCGRKQFQRTVSIVRRFDESDEWKKVRYLVFDAPGFEAPFEGRLDEIHRVVGGASNRYTEAHPHERCRGIDHVKAELDRVEELGGEGLMMRKPGSAYQIGRSSTLLKVKRFRDSEAKVIDHLPGAGRHKGRLGALLVEMPDGTRFSVGTGFSDSERERPPPVGAIVTYRFQELSDGGVPRFPTYVGVRFDFDFDAARAQSHQSRPAADVRGTGPAAAKPSRDRDDEAIELIGPKPASVSVKLRRAERVVRTEVVESHSDLEAARAAFEETQRSLMSGGYQKRPGPG
ncbi:MAG: DNA ligase [Deltaproteobacteria bacterium]|nr:DNA ligase [Deltaproteobacteria bacterium]